MEKLDAYPKNRDFYLELIALGKKCLKICQEKNIYPIIHGSIAYLFYTKDSEIEVKDLDLLIPESAIDVLEAEFTKSKIEYKRSAIYPTIKAIRGDAKVSFHSVEYFLKSLPQAYTPVDIEGCAFQILNLEALIKGYAISLKLEPGKSGEYSKKLEKLKNLV